ncbi:MAG: amidohydrolase family protein, partial [Nitrospiraceae bacterium]|nr:amidohydrolase family protein [Nitrospiraceae bacterium]
MGNKLLNPKISRSPNPLCLHTARWVVPVSGPPIENGAIATFEGKIVRTGRARELQSSCLAEIRDYGDSILCPALINAHTHLELSPLKGRLSPSGSFVDWVRALVETRSHIGPEEWAPAIKKAVIEMQKGGIIAIGDIGNSELIPHISSKMGRNWPFRGIFFRELVCPLESEPNTDLDIFGNNQPNAIWFRDLRRAFSGHAPYSVAPSVLKAIKAWDQEHSLPFSIHLAESGEEIEFLQSGLGPLKDLLKEKGHWPLGYEIPKTSPVNYLYSLGLLDRDTLCVHCVHIDQDDISILAETGATVCLCPRSNIFLGVGLAPVEKLYNSGISLALGTDSLASNDRLSIFAEMACLSRMAPGLPPEAIFRAGTYGGAKALGISKKWGTLAPGKSA